MPFRTNLYLIAIFRTIYERWYRVVVEWLICVLTISLRSANFMFEFSKGKRMRINPTHYLLVFSWSWDDNYGSLNLSHTWKYHILYQLKYWIVSAIEGCIMYHILNTILYKILAMPINTKMSLSLTTTKVTT